MASETSTTRSIKTELADITECAICADVYTDPRTLPCLHTFCYGCIDQWTKEKQSDNGVAACPMCRKTFAQSCGGLGDLPKSFFIEKLKQLKEIGTSIDATGNALCGVCSDSESGVASNSASTGNNSSRSIVTKSRKEAAVYCVDCREKLCATCDEHHNRLPATRAHARIKLGEHSTSKKLRDHLIPSFCDKHRNKSLELFCTECQTVICITCFVASHAAHRCVDVGDAADEFQQQILTDIGNMTRTADKCCELQRRISDSKKQFNDEVDRAEEEICAAADQLVKLVEKHKQALLQETRLLRQDRLKQLDHVYYEIEQHISLMHSLKQYAEELADKGAASDICRETQTVRSRIEELIQTVHISKAFGDTGSSKLTFASSLIVHSADNIIGQLHSNTVGCQLPTSEPEIQPLTRILGEETAFSELTKTPEMALPECRVLHVSPMLNNGIRDLATLSNELFVLRRRCDQSLDVYDAETFAFRRRLAVHGLSNNAFGLASCSVNNCLYVSDSENCLLFKVTASMYFGRYVKWPVAKEPGGLSVNGSGNVIVVVMSGNSFQEYTTDGCLVREIRPDISLQNINHVVHLNSGRFVLSHSGFDEPHKVYAIDRDGRIIDSFGNVPGSSMAQLNEPRRLAVRKDGLTFVADRDNHRVCMLDTTLRCLGYLSIAVHSGVNCPNALHLNESGRRLYIGEWSSGRFIILDMHIEF